MGFQLIAGRRYRLTPRLYRRMHASLSGQSLNISEKVVRRVMKQECLVVATKDVTEKMFPEFNGKARAILSKHSRRA